MVGFLQPITNVPRLPHASAQSVVKTVAPVAPVQPPTAVPEAQAVSTATQAIQTAPAVSTYVGDHIALMAAAGIDPSDYSAVDYIVSHESGWNADATNTSSGAHGLPQALPYSKTGCDWDDALCQLQWANSYAIGRYGGWQAAYNYWVNHGNW